MPTAQQTVAEMSLPPTAILAKGRIRRFAFQPCPDTALAKGRIGRFAFLTADPASPPFHLAWPRAWAIFDTEINTTA